MDISKPKKRHFVRRAMTARLPVIAVYPDERIEIEAVALVLSEQDFVKMTNLCRRYIMTGIKKEIDQIMQTKEGKKKLEEYREIVKTALGLKEQIKPIPQEK